MKRKVENDAPLPFAALTGKRGRNSELAEKSGFSKAIVHREGSARQPI
jgi:hypothetical protein